MELINMKCLVFKVRGDYARFRKSYTTTSALTYLLIHPVAVRGLIGAMLGIDREKLYEKTKDIEVAIQVVNQVRKDMQSFNLVNMKPNDKIFRFPSNIEFLRNVEYRIFIKAEDNSWIQLNATHNGVRMEPIQEGQEVIIVIGEHLQRDRIEAYIGAESV